jgi:16S rRNA (cytosine967-C5)-methyltransferase
MMAPARWAAYETLRAVTAGRLDLPAALARVRAGLPDARDRALAGEITTGTLRLLAAHDHVIAAFVRGGLARLDPEVLDILRLSAHQLLHLERVPSRAVVDDAVEMTRRAGKTSAAGLVNAVLRRIDRERATLPLPRRPSDAGANRAAALDYLATTLSHPRWLVERWLQRHGFEFTERWAAFDNAPAPLTLRVNTLRIQASALARELRERGIDTRPARVAPDALIVTAGNPLSTDLAASGLFLVQDEASQLVGLAADAHPGERVLDACASPGGKTLQMAASMDDRGVLVATDLRGRRVDLLRATVRTMGARSVRVARVDLRRALPFGAIFDRVIVDAPCSGLGTIRRDPDIRWRRREEDLDVFAGAQLEMLLQAALVVRPGGRLLYSTCSSEPEENDDVVARFLAADRRFAEAGVDVRLADPAVSVVGADGRLRTLPPEHGLEAFFAAMLVKSKDL